MIEFYPALHEYREGDTLIPSVTQILKSAGVINGFFYSEEARERGSAVHELCERYASGGRLDDKGRRLETLAYLNAFAARVRENGVYAISTETTIDHKIDGFRYCGRYDLLAEIGRERVLVDIKSGAPAKWHITQMAAYALAANPANTLLLYLKADGSYKERYIPSAEMLEGIRAFRQALWQARQIDSGRQETAAREAVMSRSWF
jgi:hypothetical protein